MRLAGRARREHDDRSDLALTPQWLHSVLELPLHLEAALLARGYSIPAGLSVAALFVRPLPAPPRPIGLVTRRPPIANAA
jgi:hypothetical protein